jgi:hypothetical protein
MQLKTKDEIRLKLFSNFAEKKSIVKIKKDLPLLECDRALISRYCCNTDVKYVILKTQRNVYNGEVKAMCKECRKTNNGAFKMWKPINNQ